jgi:DNA (cytosine-5)-methyltransferase 1
LKFLDLFSGIGGFRLGMEAAGHECAGYVEIDKFARKSYEAIHNTEGEWTAHDITTVKREDIERIGKVDVICGGFPCQAFSVAGQRKGFEDIRGTLFFDIARFADILKPKLLFLENVKGLLNHNQGETFHTILSTLDALGYDCEWELLNSRHFGVPQNRERVFIVGHLRGSGGRKVFPLGESKGLLDTERMETSACISALTATDYKGPSKQRPNLVVPVMTPDIANKSQNARRFKDNGDPMYTLTAQDRHGVFDGYKIRKLTPRECWRLQSFPDWVFDKAVEVNSDTQLYKQAGNSVTVNVVKAIAERLEGL